MLPLMFWSCELVAADIKTPRMHLSDALWATRKGIGGPSLRDNPGSFSFVIGEMFPSLESEHSQ